MSKTKKIKQSVKFIFEILGFELNTLKQNIEVLYHPVSPLKAPYISYKKKIYHHVATRAGVDFEYDTLQSEYDLYRMVEIGHLI